MEAQPPTRLPDKGETRASTGVLRVVLLYALFASLWILFSDLAVERLFNEHAYHALAQTFKGLLFVAVTSLLLWGLIRRLVAQVQATALRERQAQAEKSRALLLLDAIAKGSPDCIFAKDAEDRFILFNHASERLTGKREAEVLGRDEAAIFPAGLARQLKADNQTVMRENRALTFQEDLATAEGERAYLTTKSPLHDAEGRVVGLFGIARDITTIKQAERALRESEGRYRALVEESLAGIYIIQGGYFRYVNPSFASIFGYASPAEVIDRVPVADLVSPADRELVTGNLRRRLEGEIKDAHYSFVGVRRDGLRINVEVHGRVFDYQGHPAVIGLLLDITARKVAEAALAWQTKELRERNEELERFNRATVGREMDMIALKQQVNALSRQLGREPPFALDFLEASSPPAADAGP